MTSAVLHKRIRALSVEQRAALHRKLAAVANQDSARLVAYVKTHAATALDPEPLRRRLANQLPNHMIPSRFIQVESIPRLANGKIDRERLPHAVPVELQLTANDAPQESREAPQPDTRTSRLAKIWARNLNVEFVLPEDDFFELGGHSLLGVQLLLDVKEEFGVEIPLADLLEMSRLEDMVARLREPTSGTRVVSTIQAGTDETPIFSVHGGDKVFAQVFGPDRPLYLVFDNISTTTADMSTVEKIAAYYLDGIRSVQPHGPYLLCGFSLGGMIAYEMAVRLTKAGERVQFIGLFDPTPPHIGKRGLTLRLYRFLSRVGNERGVRNKARALFGPVARKFRWRRADPPLIDGAELTGPEAIRRANTARYVDIGFVYKYPVTSLDCVVYMPESHPFWVNHLRRKWQRAVRGMLAIKSVPGVKEHADLTRPPYDALTAEDFAQHVRAIETAEPRATDSQRQR